MRQHHRRSLVYLPFVALLFGLAVLPVKGWAIGGSCGGATPCECGDELVDSRTLVFGLDPITVTPCSGEGLVIEGKFNLTLDLGGNTIRAGASDGDGVRMNEATHITVTGGTIAGFVVGIGARLSNHNRFVALQIVEGNGGIAALGDANTVERSVFRRLRGNAIHIDGEGTQVLNNRIEDAGGMLLYISPVDHLPGLASALIARNVILRSGAAGLTVASSASILGTVIDRNQVSAVVGTASSSLARTSTSRATSPTITPATGSTVADSPLAPSTATALK